MPTVRVRDMEASYFDNGTGEPALVLLHGFPLDKRMWEPQFERLLYEFRVVTPDFRGHGESQRTPGPYTMEQLADDVAAFLDALGIGECVLGGFSMGGYVAFSFLRRHPGRARALILADTRPQADSEDGRRGREEMAGLALREGSGAVAQRMLPRLLTPASLASRPDVMDRVQRMMDQCPPETMAADLRGMAARGDSSDLLPRIGVPTLVVVGEEDAITPPADAQAMASAIPGARLVRLPGAGHASNLERPREFNAAVGDFLRAL